MGTELQERPDRPAYVRFERVAVEDKAATLASGDGRVHFKDVDFALITPPYSRDVIRIKVAQWKLNMEQDVRNERMPRKWMDDYLEAYRLWQNGQEIPLNGSAIRGWGVISPAQQETLLRMNILTVEDLAGINDEGIRRIGMGGAELKNKAVAWLRTLNDKGPLTMEIAALKQENATLKGSLETMAAQIRQLQAQMGQKPVVDDASEIVPEIPEVRRGPGRPRKDASA